ncbi:MAG: RNA polymerase sigma factor [Sedimentisphaerales bacterium]|nr:RNA polymerase sigma factor [Sedimentisphaerales bacterium]
MKDNIEINLVQRAIHGEQAAIAELFKLYWRAARATAYGVTGNIDIAEDAASEALYLAIKNIQNLEDASKFGPWLHTIVIRSAQHQKNSKSLKKPDSEKCFNENVSSSDYDIEKRELSVLIREAVSDLQDILREAISLYYFEGYKIEQIAAFIDVPIGTVKRRLHDGRNALRDSAEKIMKGKKPMNNKRELIIKQLNDFLEKGGDSDDFNKVMGQAMTLRPVPYELLRKIFSKHSQIAKKLTDPEERRKYELRAHKVMEIIRKPSQRVTDLNHPVCKVMNAIKSALTAFKEREEDTNALAENIIKLHTTGEVNSSSSMPPGFVEGIPGSFISYARQAFFEKVDGTLCTMYELDWPKDKVNIKGNGLISEVLYLTWLRKEIIELRSVEELLRDLALKVVPDTKYILSSYSDPRISSGLQMNFEGITLPAATGGVNFAWPGLPEGVSVASVILYLEAWASAQSGQNIGLKKLDSFFKKLREKEEGESNDKAQ